MSNIYNSLSVNKINYQNHHNYSKIKSTLCRNYVYNNGYCPIGIYCKYAHSI